MQFFSCSTLIRGCSARRIRYAWQTTHMRYSRKERLQHLLGGANVLGTAIRQARHGRGLTQARLAKLAGVSRRYVIDIEKGANPSMATFLAIVKVMPEMPYRLGDFVVLHLHAGA